MKTRATGYLLALALCLTGLSLTPRAFADKPQQFDTLTRYATLILDGEKEERFPPHNASGGVTRYTPSGPEFKYRLNAHGLQRMKRYTLLYLPEPFPGQGLLCLGTATSNVAGALHMQGAPDLSSNLPIATDQQSKQGARIALVLSHDVDCANQRMLTWDSARYLFGRRLIRYHDTNIDAVDYSGTYCVVRERPGNTGLFEMLIAQSGSTLTVTAEGITISGVLSGQSATLTGALLDGTPFTVGLQFADDGTNLTGTLTVSSEISTLTGSRDRCFDYEFPAGDPQCILPVADPGLVVGGQQFNNVTAGVTHTGVDFKFAGPLPAIVAPCDGVVVEIKRHAIALGNIIINVVIKYNNDWSTFIAFEPYSPYPAIADEQASRIAVTVGQVVHRGDLLGHLFVPDPITDFPHIHWQVYRNDAARTPACPRSFLTLTGQAELDALYGSFGRLPVCLPPP